MHTPTEALFAKVEAGEPEALKELASALAAHMTIEHEFYDPEIAEVALKRALALDPEDESFDARVSVLEELIAHHVKEEEGELFPEMGKQLDSDALEALGQTMERRFDEVLALGFEPFCPITSRKLRPMFRSPKPPSREP